MNILDARKVFEELGFEGSGTCFSDGEYDVELLCNYNSNGAIVREMVVRSEGRCARVDFENHDLDEESLRHAFLTCKDFFDTCNDIFEKPINNR